MPPRPPLTAQRVRARGLDFAVYTTPPVAGTVPLCCINGGLLFDHRLLWPALAPLARDRQLVFYDQRGRGHTAVPPAAQNSRLEFDAGDVPALREALGIPTWDLLGHSWGGGIAMLAAASDAAAIRRMILVNAVGVTSDWLAPLHEAALSRLTGDAQALLAACDPMRLTDPDLAVHASYARAFFPAWFADPAFASAVTPPTGQSTTGAAVAARLRREGYDWTDRLRDLPVETLVVHGVADLLPLSEASRTVAVLAKARLAPIAEAGHNPFWEAAESFFATVQAFLTEDAPAP
jgi:proline iminopeptidase